MAGRLAVLHSLRIDAARLKNPLYPLIDPWCQYVPLVGNEKNPCFIRWYYRNLRVS
jgi:hypothetical protein